MIESPSYKRIALVAIILAAAIGCTKRSSSSQGGQDGGGGYVRYSTGQEVRQAISKALALSKAPQYDDNIFYYFAEDLSLQSKRSIENRNISLAYSPDLEPSELENKELGLDDKVDIAILGVPRWCISPTDSERASVTIPRCADKGAMIKHFVSILSASPILIREHGDCGMSTDGHADASVSKLSKGAVICYSLERLARVPPASLLSELLALTLHEAMHLNGFGEEDARAAQEAFVTYFNKKFAVSTSGTILDSSAEFVADLENEGNAIQDLLAQSSVDDDEVWAHIGRAFQGIRDLSRLGGFLAFRLSVPEQTASDAIVAYQHSVAASLLRLSPTLAYQHPVQPTISVMPDECWYEKDPGAPVYVPPSTLDGKPPQTPQLLETKPLSKKCALWADAEIGDRIPDPNHARPPSYIKTDLKSAAQLALASIDVIYRNWWAMKDARSDWDCADYDKFDGDLQKYETMFNDSAYGSDSETLIDELKPQGPFGLPPTLRCSPGKK